MRVQLSHPLELLPPLRRHLKLQRHPMMRVQRQLLLEALPLLHCHPIPCPPTMFRGQLKLLLEILHLLHRRQQLHRRQLLRRRLAPLLVRNAQLIQVVHFELMLAKTTSAVQRIKVGCWIAVP